MANANKYRLAYCHAVDETAAAMYCAVKFYSGGARTKSPTGLFVYLSAELPSLTLTQWKKHKLP